MGVVVPALGTASAAPRSVLQAIPEVSGLVLTLSILPLLPESFTLRSADITS